MWSLQPRRLRRNSQRGDILEETKIISERSQARELATALATGVTVDDMSDTVASLEWNREATWRQQLCSTCVSP